MARVGGHHRRIADGFPHPRGDGPGRRSARIARLPGFPHARGDGPLGGCRIPPRDAHCPCGFPHARGDGPRTLAGDVYLGFDFPTPRGDGPSWTSPLLEMSSISPRPWGWPEWESTVPVRIADFPRPWGWPVLRPARLTPPTDFPTPVGMARGPWQATENGDGFPHARGDGPAAITQGFSIAQISPRPWGWPDIRPAGRHPHSDFPTPVGMAGTSARRSPA